MENLKLQVVENAQGKRVVVLPEVIFKGKRTIDWKAVEKYLQKYVGEMVLIADTKDRVYIGSDFPDEFKGSRYTNHLKGANAKAKANAAQGIREMIEIASNKRYKRNYEEKHAQNAEKGWYYYTTRFAVPICMGENRTGDYNIYSACLIVNHASNGKLYLYDLVDIKKEASTPLKTGD